MNWLLHPFGYYTLLALSLVLTLYLFVSAKQDSARIRNKLSRQSRETQEDLAELRAVIVSLAQALQAAAPPSPPAHQSAGKQILSINLTKRSQALRMHRRGESAEEICAALQMPRHEVDLLLKVEQARSGKAG